MHVYTYNKAPLQNFLFSHLIQQSMEIASCFPLMSCADMAFWYSRAVSSSGFYLLLHAPPFSPSLSWVMKGRRDGGICSWHSEMDVLSKGKEAPQRAHAKGTVLATLIPPGLWFDARTRGCKSRIAETSIGSAQVFPRSLPAMLGASFGAGFQTQVMHCKVSP